MKVALNTMVKNEEDVLQVVLPIWNTYEVDYFIFYNDNSTDNTINVINKLLPKEKVVIVNDNLEKFNEGYHRQRMLDISRELNVDYIISLDSDELLGSTIVKDFKNFLSIYDSQDMLLFWYNIVDGDLNFYRTDNLYTNNYRSFVLPVKNMGDLDTNLSNYHTPRTPNISLPKTFTKDYGVIHLQSVNRKFYTFKQLWYKHYELINYGYSVDHINAKYDPVVNGLNFNPNFIPQNIIEGINIDLSIFDGLENKKGYVEFIKENYNEGLITFGKEYITWN
jgi:hypothetical protein